MIFYFVKGGSVIPSVLEYSMFDFDHTSR
jgi:hypothetical protein